MLDELISINELTEKRTPSDLLNWVRQKTAQIEYTDEGETALRLHKGLAKQLMEEVYPLSLFGQCKFGDTNQILIQPIIGNQSYDAIITDMRDKPASKSYVEITQSHEGEADYLRRLVLQRQGIVFMHSPVAKKGTKRRGMQISIPAKAVSVNEVARDELIRIVDAAKRKAAKDYPSNTSLIIVFDDDLFFRKVVDNAMLNIFIKKHILKLDLRFSTFYLLGWHEVFQEYSL